MPQKLTLLVFSMGRGDQLLDLVRHMYSRVDQIVVVDSSGKAEFRKLEKDIRGMRKVDLFWAVALGYPDPLRMWALKKCRNEWVLLLDTDERLNEELENRLNAIISSARHDAFAIKRYEEVKRGKRQSNFFTWQVRLFRKSRTEFRGVLHEQPLIRGSIGRLGEDLYMNHRAEDKMPTGREYNKINKVFDRLSYAEYNKRMLEYASKLTMPEGVKAGNAFLGRFVASWLGFYERVTFRKQEEEIANSDYYAFVLLRNLAYGIKRRGLSGIPAAFAGASAYMRVIKRLRSETDSKEFFEISKAVGRIGIIRYLGLDRESVIRRLNEKYAGRPQGTGLLLRLLQDRYRSGR